MPLLLSALLLHCLPRTLGNLPGYATRYWDCCKPHCTWTGNTFGKVDPIASCNKESVKQSDFNIVNACDDPKPGSAFTCYDNVPWSVNGTFAYGFAATPAQGDICGLCYEFTFTGEGKYGPNPGAAALRGKVMIVQASNIGHDVADGQFDVMIPGGGVGIFDACSYQWDVTTPQLGNKYGGFLSECQEKHGSHADHGVHKQCVLDKCNSIFNSSKFSRLHDGCKFFVDWYEVADNPTHTYRQVPCPKELEQVSGMSREFKEGDEPEDCVDDNTCGCTWASESSCGYNDGSKCNCICCKPFRQPKTVGTTTLQEQVQHNHQHDNQNDHHETTTTMMSCSCGWASKTNCKTDDGSVCNQECCKSFRP
mmetsp:Transcript_24469/g.44539  ORF Transcript_24469/g.44539 Transcript_24469/m.44539 type:complete len:365 (+) Transcript_24469:45-1139(+)